MIPFCLLVCPSEKMQGVGVEWIWISAQGHFASTKSSSHQPGYRLPFLTQLTDYFPSFSVNP